MAERDSGRDEGASAAPRTSEAGDELFPTARLVLERAMRRHASRPFLTAVADDGSTRTLTYGELDAVTAGFVHWLRTGPGVPAGRPVGLLPVNDADSVVALLGLVRGGYPALVLHPHDPPARLAEQCAALGTEVVLHGDRVAAADVPGAVCLPGAWPDADGLLPAEAGAAPRPADDCLYFGTSGSTAASKLVAQTHGAVAANAEAVRRHHGLAPGDRFLGCLPLHHVNGVHFTLFGTLAAGAHAVLAERFAPFSYPALLTRHRPRIASVVPQVLDALADSWRRPEVPAEFRYFVTAAAPLTTETARAAHHKLGVRVVQGYGLTETVNFSTTMPVALDDDTYRRLVLDAPIPSVGVAVHGNEVAVLDPEGTPLGHGEVGEICMRGPNVMSRYVGNPEATDEALRGGWFHSQDLGHTMADPSDGRPYVVLTGRIKNMAKVRGETVSLEEVERALRGVPGVRDAACSAVPDPVLGEAVVALVAAPADLSDAYLVDRLRGRVPRAAVPVRFLRRTSVPRTATGKILRPEVREIVA